MTSNPYAQTGGPGGFGTPGYGGGGDMMDPLSSRTSILAVLSLVFSLICFIPGSGALAVIFGGAAVLFISTSQGRLRGMGLAITGIVLGLLFTLLWIFVVVGMSQAMGFFSGQFVKPADTTMMAIQKGDYKAARAMFTPAADKAITDEMLADFAKRYQAETGNYKGAPQSMMELFSAYAAAGQAMQGQRGSRSDAIPFPAYFDKGTEIIILEIDPDAMPNHGPPPGPTGSFQLPVMNICVLTVNGKEIWLVDPKDAQKLMTPATPEPDADMDPDAAPADPDKPAPSNSDASGGGGGGTNGKKPKF